MSAIAFPTQLLPLAQREVWSRLGDRFSGKNAQFSASDWAMLIGVVLLAVAFIWGLRWIQQLQAGRRTSNQPRHLFDDLCAAHRLTRRERRLLRRMAVEAGFEVSAQLFLSPECFEDRDLAAECGIDSATLLELQHKLFAGLEEIEVPGEAASKASKRPATVPVVGLETPPTHATPLHK